MTCEQAEQWMSERLDERLAEAQEQQLNAHLEACPQCRREWALLQRTWQALEFPELEPGPLFRAQVWEKIRQQPVVNPMGSPVRWLRWLVPALCLCFLWMGWQQFTAPTAPEAPATLTASPSNLEVATAGLDEWNLDVEVLPSVEALGQSEVALDEGVPLGDLSHDYLAHSQDALDELLEEM